VIPESAAAGNGQAADKWTGFQRAELGLLGRPHTHRHQIMELFVMPKMKTKKSAAKRFVVRPGGTVKRGQAFKRHILTKKTTKNKRHLRGSAAVHESNLDSVRAMMPFA
jgi:large subunit ribosomal protein L35